MSRRFSIAAAALVTALQFTRAAAVAAPLEPASFDYPKSPAPVTQLATATAVDGVAVRDLQIRPAAGRIITGAIVFGEGSAPHPAVLFVHWLGDAQTTNHTEFLRDAAALAKRGVTSLLVDAMWSQPNWFEKGRTTADDYQRSIDQVVDLRRALDVLLAQRNIDASRVAYVGHDFGAMYGAVLSGVDPRPKYYVLMAGTTTFAQWYLLGSQPPDKAAYIAQMNPLDPVLYVARATAKSMLFQFSNHDEYVTQEEAKQFASATSAPHQTRTYNVGHSLETPAAHTDRLNWLSTALHLRQ